MGRNRLDFVGPGIVAGQVASVASGPNREHIGERDGEDDQGNWGPVEYTYTLPGQEATILLSGHPFVYHVRAVDGENGPQLVELHIEQPQYEPDVPLTADDLRKLARLLDRLAYAAIGGLGNLMSPKTFTQPEKKRPGRRGHGDDFYAEIAEYARHAHRDRHRTGQSVREAISKRYNVTRDSADKWLARARRAGLLEPGELGGKPKPRKQTVATDKDNTNA